MRNPSNSLPIAPRASRARAVAVASLAAVALTACSSQTAPGSIQGSLVGVGTSSQEGAVAAWAKNWKNDHPAVSIAYSPDGAEVGKTSLTRGLSYFAAGDSPLDAATASNHQSACGPDGLISVPVAVVPVGVAFNLGSIQKLQLNGPLLAAILKGKITKWNDPQIEAANPGLALPSIDVVPVLEKPPSDVTKAVNKYLSKEVPSSWNTSSGSQWPDGTVGRSEVSVSDVTQQVEKTTGAITVLNKSIIGSRFAVARLEFDGVYQTFGNDSTSSATEAGETVDFVPQVIDQKLDGTQGYALAVVEHQYFCKSYPNNEIAAMVRSWGQAVLSGQGQKDAVVYSSSLPPSTKTTAEALKLISSISSVNR